MPRYRLHECGLVTVSSNPQNRVIPHKSNGKKTKSYYIDWRIYREIISSAVVQFENKVNNIVFLTLTFPEDISEENANNAWIKFAKNLKNNYKLHSYVCVKEFTELGRPHYHALLDIPFFNIKDVNNAWCSAFRDYCSSSPNAARLPTGKNKSVVNDVVRVAKYLGKYVAKGVRDGRRYRTRCYFITRNIRSRPRELTHDEYVFLCDNFNTSHVVREDNYSAITYIRDVVFPSGEVDKPKSLANDKSGRTKKKATGSVVKKIRKDGFKCEQIRKIGQIEPNLNFDSERGA